MTNELEQLRKLVEAKAKAEAGATSLQREIADADFVDQIYKTDLQAILSAWDRDREELAGLRSELKKATTPSWFWNDEEPETPYSSPDEWLECEDWGLAHGHKVCFMTAKKLPDQYFRVVNVSEDDKELVEITKEEYKAAATLTKGTQ